jgi:hypothetical protein
MKNGNQRKWLKTTAAALLPLMAASVPYSTPGWAIVNNSANPNAVNISALEPEKVNCNDFCENLVAKVANGGWTDKDSRKEYRNVMNTSGGSGWSLTDDQFCANHGYPTNPSVQAATVSVNNQACNVTMLQGQSYGTGTEGCKRASDAIFRCQMHNSQVIPQCLAYKAAKTADDGESVVLALDIAAAATCGAECALAPAGAVGSAVAGACQIAGTSATVMEVIQNSRMAYTERAMQSVLGGAGTIAGGTATAVNILNAGDAAETGSETNIGLGSGGGDEVRKKNQRKASCYAAASFAFLAGLRTYNIRNDMKAKDDACKAVRGLASNVLTGSPGTAGNQGAGTGTGFNGINTGGSATGDNGSGGSNGSYAGAGTGTGTENINCSGPLGCEVPPTLSSATDGGVLTQSGLDKLVGKPAADIAAALKSGVTPAQALQSAMGSAGAGQMGGALASLAQSAQDNASSLGGSFNMSSPAAGAMYAAGGGGGGGRSGGDSNPFGNLFGGQGGAGAGGARALASEEFGKGRATDIWHTGTTQNLFEIVSGKVSQVSGRVGAR